jgi:pimeloyl-ACP methyl ester carboxylesterase
VQAAAVLAERVVRSRQQTPQDKVYLIGHSAGAHVVLLAGEMLPAGYVERIVLIAPAVSHRYDLRRALSCSRHGIDSFHSGRDFMVAGAMLVGTADGQVGQAAGKIGFTPVPASEPDGALYLNLRQHAWNENMAQTGHHGGHFGMARGNFLQTYVAPLFQP